MATKAQMVRWGNSLAVRIPKSIAEKAELKEGDGLVIEVREPGAIAVRSEKRPPTLEQLVARITPENVHRAIDWGGPVGNEVW